MNAEVEDQIRAAIRAKAETLREVQPLRLPSEPGGQPGPGSGTQPRRARRLRPWIVPVTAAAAVIALAISLVLVRDIPNGRVVSPPRPTPASGGVPRYYAALIPQGKGITWNEVIVNDTFTGARLATVKPPHGSTFGVVTAAADDRTFVVTAAPIYKPPGAYVAHSWWYLLRIAPGTSSPARLTRLAIPDLRVLNFYALALSSSGRELAVGFAQSMSSPVQLRIYSVTTGKLERAWSTRDKTVLGGGGGWPGTNTALTWVDDDRALAFSTQSRGFDRGKDEDVTHETLRLLDKSAGGSDLIADSRVIWSAQSVTSLPQRLQPAELWEHRRQSDAHRRREDDRVCCRQEREPTHVREPADRPRTLDAGVAGILDVVADRGPHRRSVQRRGVPDESSRGRPAVDRLVGWHANRHVERWQLSRPEPSAARPVPVGRDRRWQVPPADDRAGPELHR